MIADLLAQALQRYRTIRWCWVLMTAVSPLAAANAEPVADTAAPTVGLIGPALRVTDFDRAIKFYTTGLGMAAVTKLHHGTTTEVILAFGADVAQPVILLYKDEAPGKSPPIEHGDGFGRLILRVSDATALAARLSAAGYSVGEVRSDSANHVKVFWVEDSEGYKYEITEVPSTKH